MSRANNPHRKNRKGKAAPNDSFEQGGSLMKPQAPVSGQAPASTDIPKGVDAAPPGAGNTSVPPRPVDNSNVPPARLRRQEASMPLALQALRKEYLDIIDCLSAGVIDDSAAESTIGSLQVVDEDGYTWGIDMDGNFTRRDTPDEAPVVADPSRFSGEGRTDRSVLPKRRPAPRKRASSSVAEGLSSAAASVGGALKRKGKPSSASIASTPSSGQPASTSKSSSRPLGRINLEGFQGVKGAKTVNTAMFLILLGVAASVAVVGFGRNAPEPQVQDVVGDRTPTVDGAVPDSFSSSAAQDVNPRFVEAVQTAAPFLVGSNTVHATCLAGQAIDTLDPRMGIPRSGLPISAAINSALPSEAERAYLAQVVVDGTCFALEDVVAAHYKNAGTDADRICAVENILPTAQEILITEMSGFPAAPAAYVTLQAAANDCTAKSEAVVQEVANVSEEDTNLLRDIPGPTSRDARLILTHLMNGDPDQVVAQFADQRDVPSEGEIQTTTALLVGLRAAGATGSLLEVELDDTDATQVVGLNVSGSEVGKLTIRWEVVDEDAGLWKLSRWPSYRAN